MRKKILSALLLGLFTVASTSTFVSCKDYDDDISNLQEQITQNNTDLKKLVDDKIAIVNAEIQKVNDALDAAEKACADADKKLQANIDAANKAITDGDAATLAAAKKAVEDAMVQVAATYATKAELQKAQSDLETAYKAADELIKKDVESNAKEIANLLEADKKLDAAVKTAQATADDALTLAKNIERTYATKAELADEIKKVNESLAGVKTQLEGKIGENLQKISALEERAGNIETSIAGNKTAIEALQSLTTQHTTTLANLGSDMVKVCDNLKTLDAAIASNAARLETVKESITDAYKQAISVATETLNSTITATNVRIDELNTALNTNVSTEISTISATLQKADSSINVAKDSIDSIKVRIEKFEPRLTIVNADLSNLITSIIYNGQSKSAVVYGEMTANSLRGNHRFPYNNYEGKDSIALADGTALMSANGIIYATINPAEIDFTGDSVKMVNSQNAEHALFALGKAEKVTESDPILTITRGGENQFGQNGLYKFQIKVRNAGIKSADFVGKNSVYATIPTGNNDACIAYALQATYNAGDSTRTVTSHYDLAIVPKSATAVNTIDILPVDPGQAHGADSLVYEIEESGSLEGEFKLDKTFTDIYAAYVELDTVGRPALVKQFKNVKISVNKVFVGENISQKIKIEASDDLVNVAIPVKAYGLNYDGSIVTTTKKIVFSRSLFGAINIEVVDTLKGSGDQIPDLTQKLIAELKKAKGENGLKLFVENAVLPVDSVKNGVYRIHVDAATRATANDSVKNTFKYVPGSLTFMDGKSVLTQTMEFTSASGLKVATVNYKLTVVLPRWYDELNMRIKSAFGVIDGDKDYTVGWTTKDNTNAGKTKVAYEWNHRSFNISRFTTAKNDRSDTESTLSYKTSATYAPYNQFVNTDATAQDSVSVTHIKIFQGNGITAINTNAGADTVNTKFDVQQVVNYYGLAEKVIDNFKFSIASPINYGIFMGGVKTVNATVASSGKGTADLTSFQWNDYSNNLATFKLDDDRIASVECVLVQDTENYYDRIENHTIEVKRASNKLEFNVVPGVITKAYPVYADVIITDYWGIKTSLRICINVSAYNTHVTTNP